MYAPVCLNCERPLSVSSDLEVGDTLICPQCQTELALISLNPPKVDWPHDDTYDDWDGDVDDYEDELDDEWLDDDDEWLDDEDDDYSWMLSKQKRHQEVADLDRRRPPRPDVAGDGGSRGAARSLSNRRNNGGATR